MKDLSKVLQVAGKWQSDANTQLQSSEKIEQEKYASLVKNQTDKLLLNRLLDESSQAVDYAAFTGRIKSLVKRYGYPSFLSGIDKIAFQLLCYGGSLAPTPAIKMLKKKLRYDTRKIIIPEEENGFRKHTAFRNSQGIKQNVNLLGEVVLGEGEAINRYNHYLKAIEHPEINYISVKISGIYAQLYPLNYKRSKKILIERMTALYEKAIAFPHKGEPKFINMDMEEYKDLELTKEVFMETLDKPSLQKYHAGIVIQAYLPDAHNLYNELLEWSKKRVANGGAPIKVRFVKGANLQMEEVFSSLRHWEVPIFSSKVEVDANYLALIDKAFVPENMQAIHIGVASHNLFSLAYAYMKAEENKVSQYVSFEMLEGMSNHVVRMLNEIVDKIILYTPVVKEEHFLNAVSYLVRRLDENTSPDNFISHSFNLTSNSKDWSFLRDQFLEAHELKEKLDLTTRRKQDRSKVEWVQLPTEFKGEADTDFDLPKNQQWAESILEKWKPDGQRILQVPLQIGEKQITTKDKRPYFDRCQDNKVKVAEVSLGSWENIEEMISLADEDPDGWRKTSLAERHKILHEVANQLRKRRGDLIGCMAGITGKTFMEGDVEVSEAIDFAEYYPLSFSEFESLPGVEHTPKGVVLVISPWNFPTAIPAGGPLAALAAGNTVLLKPAPDAFPIAWEFAQAFWEAGVPKSAFQLIFNKDDADLTPLVQHPSIKHTIFTGSTQTAFKILNNNPSCSFSAETGGKNAIIVTANCDKDVAVKSIVTSAFSNAGQKCSACSLVLLDKHLYNDSTFQKKLKDATETLTVGSVWDLGNLIGPMITNENEKLFHAIEDLKEGESWLIPPTFVDEEKYIMRPAIKWGVTPSSYSFRTELFAPLLSVARIDSLEEGIDLVNSLDYGLTSGLQTLSDEEQAIWRDKIEAGNLYINRTVTGAIVERQPFGGMKASAFGAGIKAGGVNYVQQFVNFTETALPSEEFDLESLACWKQWSQVDSSDRLKASVQSYLNAYQTIFSQEVDVSNIIGEQNVFRYLPVRNIGVRIEPNDNLEDLFMVTAALTISRSGAIISISPQHKDAEKIKTTLSSIHECIVENQDQFIDKINDFERVRCLSSPPQEYFIEAAKKGTYIAHQKPIAHGRIELLHYLQEQSVTYEYHRYGYLGSKK